MILWFTIPPLLSLPLALILVAFGSAGNRVSVGAPLWVLLLMFYFALSVLYAFSIRRESFDMLTPVQLASQGTIISLVSIEAGTHPIIPWIGIILAISGCFTLVHYYFRYTPPTPSRSQKEETPAPKKTAELSTLPFPLVCSDDEGTILAASEAFESLAGGTLPEGANITEYFSPGELEAVVAGTKHTLIQKARNGRFYFLLLDSIPSAKSPESTGKRADFELYDSKTGFFSKGYAQIRTRQELSRATRYRRWLCGILLKMSCTYLPGMSNRPELEETFFVAYAQYVKTVIRESDMAFLMGEDEILLLLPETPQQGAKDTSLKLIDLPESLLEMKMEYPFSVEIEYGFLYYSGNYPLEPEQFMEKLYSSLGGATE